MKTLIAVLIIVQTIWNCYAPPVVKNEKETSGENADPMDFIHYNKYLKQVVNILESDPGFKKKLEDANEDDIKSGKIAHELDFVSHHIRTQLDELKRVELERLIDLKHQLIEQGVNENSIIGDPLHGHLDRSNKHTFEIEDLKKLIAKTTQDLAEADRRRRDEFKQYEIEKEIKRQEQLNHTNDAEERAKLEKQFKEHQEKHKKHEPLHEPGHKDQLDEVWKEQDHQEDKFNPKVFFALHDTNSDKYWDQNEVKALLIRELDKLYQAGAPENDPRERAEEMERMREAVFNEIDLDRDGFISEQEFISQTKTKEFEQDHGWKGLDEQPEFTEEELQNSIRQRQMLHPPPPGYHMPPGGQYPPGGYHPNQVPQGYPPPGQYYQGQQPPQYQQQQPPQYQQQQPPQYQQQQPPQYQQQQPPQYQHQPSPGQYQQAQPPHYQQPPNPPPPPGKHYQPASSPPSNPHVQASVQQPISGQIPNQPPPSPVGQQYQPPVQQVNQPSQNQPSPQINPQLNINQPNVNAHEAGKPVHTS